MEHLVVSAEEFDRLLALLDEPAKEIPELKRYYNRTLLKKGK